MLYYRLSLTPEDPRERVWQYPPRYGQLLKKKRERKRGERRKREEEEKKKRLGSYLRRHFLCIVRFGRAASCYFRKKVLSGFEKNKITNSN